MTGTVKNRSGKTLWVVKTDCGPAYAHKLAPNRRSPSGCDADGFKSVDGTPIDGHGSWVKVTSISTADVHNTSDGKLTRGCIACYNVGDNQFGDITYMHNDGWGEPL